MKVDEDWLIDWRRCLFMKEEKSTMIKKYSVTKDGDDKKDTVGERRVGK